MKVLMKQVEKAALPILLSNWIFGIGIIEYPIGKQQRVISFLYTATVLIIYCSLSIHAYPNILALSKDYEVSQEIMKLIYYTTLSLTISTIILGWHRSEGMRFILNQMSVSNRLLEKLGVLTNYTKPFITQIGHVTRPFVLILVLIVIHALVICMHGSVQSGHVMTVFVVNYPLIIMLIIDSSLMNIIGYAHGNLRKINRVLRGLLTATPDCPQHTRIIQNYLRNLETSETDIHENSVNKEKLHIIQTAKEAHLNLVKVCQEADYTFGLHILLSIIISVAVITISLYHIYILVVLAYLNIVQEGFYKTLVSVCIRIFYYYAKLYVLSHFCSKISEEAVITGDIISELYDEPSIGTETQKEIREFHVQMMQNSLKFKARGFIAIDLTLIGTMIGSVTTYLIILAQFGNVIET